MEAKELMVGDLMNHIELPYKVGKVSTIDETSRFVVVRDTNGNSPFSVEVSRLEPVLLTEEILKANGWEKRGGHYCNGVSDCYCKKGFVLSISENGFYVYCGMVSLLIVHVHQLQHALRLCRLNDLADNFKIK